MTDASALIDYHQDSDRLTELVAGALADARRRGATEAAASAGANLGLSVTVRMGELETIEHHRSKTLGITVYFGKKFGAATTTDFSPAAIAQTVEAACRIARHTQEDEYAGLAEAELMATHVPALDLCHPWGLSPEHATDLALEAETTARDFDARITNSEGAMVDEFQGNYVFGNSHGFMGAYPLSRHRLSCTVIAEQGNDKQRDFWHTVARRPDALEAPKAVGVKAAERTLGRLGARQAGTGNVPVLFIADQATRLFRHLGSAIQGTSLYRNASFLVDHLGKQVFAENIRIREDPHIRGALGSAPFDHEGVETRARDLVADGVLQGYVLDAYAARKLGLRSTGNAGGPHNLLVGHAGAGFSDLVKSMHRGLVVTELMGMGVNIVTGDYSRGAVGYWVEHGEIQYPVEEITIAGNLRDMFLGIQAVGNDLDSTTHVITGSVLIDNMTVAGE